MDNMTCINQVKKALSDIEYKDETLSNVISELIISIAMDQSNIPDNGIGLINKFRDISSKYFSDIFISEFTKEWYIHTLCDSVILNDLEYFIKITLFILNKNIVKDTTLQRLLYFKKYFNTQVIKKDILYVLNYEFFCEFLEKDFFNHDLGVKVFFISIDIEEFQDTMMYDFLNDYLERTKLSDFTTINSLYIELSAIKKISNYFRPLKISIIDQSVAVDYFNTLNKKDIHPTYFTKLFFNCMEKYNPGDPFYQKILRLKDDLFTFSRIDSLFMIYSSSTPENFYFFKKYECRNLVLINSEYEEIREVILEFLIEHSTTINHEKKFFLSKFSDSLGNLKVVNVFEFNNVTLQTQIDYFQTNNIGCVKVTIAFYLFIFRNYNKRLFSTTNDFNIDVFQRQNFVSELLKGYKLITYSPFDKIPESDKWLIYYSGFENSNNSINKNSSNAINFSTVENVLYRKYLKYYFWNNNVSINTKLKNVSYCRSFFNYIHEIKTGQKTSFFSQKSNDLSISSSDIIAYKNHLQITYQNKVTINKYIYIVRGILIFLNDHGQIELDTATLYHLSFSAFYSKNNAISIPNVELEKLASLLKLNADNSITNAIYYAVFYILLETEFRISQVLTLKSDCVHETYKENQFVIKSTSKNSPVDFVEQPITIYVKRHIDEILRLTEDFRNTCYQENLAKFLFVVPTIRKGMHRLITKSSFNEYLKKCCKILNLKEYTSSNLRDTHMTKSEEYIIRNQLSDLDMSVLTGHKSINTTTKHYIDKDVTEMLESVHGILIGNVNIEGKVIISMPSELKNNNAVSNNCGYCSAKLCTDLSYLDCMLCNFFVTCVDRIPYFEEQIKIIDFKISNSENYHDIEDLRSIKILLAVYLKKLIVLKEDI